MQAGYPGVAQLVARVVWDHEAAGSIPVTRTNKDSDYDTIRALFSSHIAIRLL